MARSIPRIQQMLIRSLRNSNKIASLSLKANGYGQRKQFSTFKHIGEPVNLDPPVFSGGYIANAGIHIRHLPKEDGAELKLPGAAFGPGFNFNGSLFTSWNPKTFEIFRHEIPTGKMKPVIKFDPGHEIKLATTDVGSAFVAMASKFYHGSVDNQLQLFKTNEPMSYKLGNEKGSPNFNSPFSCIEFNPQGNLLVSGHFDSNIIYFWDLTNLKKEIVNKPSYLLNLSKPGDDFGVSVSDLTFDSKGEQLAIANYGTGNLNRAGASGYLLQLKDFTKSIRFMLPEGWGNPCIAFSADGKTIATGGKHLLRNPNNESHAAVHIWDQNGTLTNQGSLVLGSGFIGGKNGIMRFVAFDEGDKAPKVLSVEHIGNSGDTIRACDMKGNNTMPLGKYPKIFSFLYPKVGGQIRGLNLTTNKVRLR